MSIAAPHGTAVPAETKCRQSVLEVVVQLFHRVSRRVDWTIPAYKCRQLALYAVAYRPVKVHQNCRQSRVKPFFSKVNGRHRVIGDCLLTSAQNEPNLTKVST